EIEFGAEFAGAERVEAPVHRATGEEVHAAAPELSRARSGEGEAVAGAPAHEQILDFVEQRGELLETSSTTTQLPARSASTSRVKRPGSRSSRTSSRSRSRSTRWASGRTDCSHVVSPVPRGLNRKKGRSGGERSRAYIGSRISVEMLAVYAHGFAPFEQAHARGPRAGRPTARSVVIDPRIRSGWVSASCFPIHSTFAAIVRATLSLARFGLVPASSSTRSRHQGITYGML
ncbi:MAG: hypothetical protein H6Q91_3510, partial [Deltaproteobacteria bacterium]|nr:hypothetical protein [Deltaproteobacteria bacterium]